MSLPKKIALLWLCLLCAQAVSTYFIVTPILFSASLSFAIQSFITIVLIFLVLKEPTKRGKFIFLNFAFVFFIGLLNFVGGYFGSQEFRYYYYIYIVQSISISFLALAIVYLTCDTLFRNISILIKYIITFVIVCGVFYYYYSPYFFNTKYLSETQDYRDWTAIYHAHQEIVKETSAAPSAVEIASRVHLQIWKDGKAIGQLYDQEKLSGYGNCCRMSRAIIICRCFSDRSIIILFI